MHTQIANKGLEGQLCQHASPGHELLSDGCADFCLLGLNIYYRKTLKEKNILLAFTFVIIHSDHMNSLFGYRKALLALRLSRIRLKICLMVLVQMALKDEQFSVQSVFISPNEPDI